MDQNYTAPAAALKKLKIARSLPRVVLIEYYVLARKDKVRSREFYKDL